MGSKDNMTTLVIKFPAQKVGSGGGVLARRQLRDAAANNNNSDSQIGSGGEALSAESSSS